MKVLFYTNIPSPYRVDFYNELGKYCDLTVLFEMDTSLERDEVWKSYQFNNFNGIILNGKRVSVDTAFCPNIIKYIKRKKYDFVVVTVLASPTALLAVSILRGKKIPYYYEGDGGFVSSVVGLKARIKRYIISGAQKCFSTSNEFDRYCIAYGAQKEKVIRYPFTSVKKDEVLKQTLSEDERRKFKEEYKVTEECAIISVGQFISRKGFDLLLECSRFLPENVGVYIVGGKPSEEYLLFCEKYKLHHVHFVEFMPKTELMKFYRAMDMFVLFTREDIWGLVINEAMANGLPVISTDRCIAAMELITQGENGIIVQSENIEQMRDALLKLVNSKKLREKMAENAIECMKWYTIENLAAEHMRIFESERKINR